MCKGKIYKVRIDNVNNIISGDGNSRFTVQLSTIIQKEFDGKLFNAWIEFAQLDSEITGGEIGTDDVAIACNLSQLSTYNSKLDGSTNVLGYFPSQRHAIDANNSVLNITQPTSNSFIGSIPSTIDFWLCSIINQTLITLPPTNESPPGVYRWMVVICFQEADEE